MNKHTGSINNNMQQQYEMIEAADGPFNGDGIYRDQSINQTLFVAHFVQKCSF